MKYSSVVKFKLHVQGVGFSQNVRISDRLTEHEWDRLTEVEQKELISHWVSSWALKYVYTSIEEVDPSCDDFNLWHVRNDQD